MNHLVLAGNLGADPETRVLESGARITTLKLAARLQRGKEKRSVWWRINLWGNQFDGLLPFLKKGSSIVVAGDMHEPRCYLNREQQPQVTLEMSAQSISLTGSRPEQREEPCAIEEIPF